MQKRLLLLSLLLIFGALAPVAAQNVKFIVTDANDGRVTIQAVALPSPVLLMEKK